MHPASCRAVGCPVAAAAGGPRAPRRARRRRCPRPACAAACRRRPTPGWYLRRRPNPMISSSMPSAAKSALVLGRRAGGALRVGPVDGGLVGLPPGPERQRGRRGYERGALHRGIGRGQGLRERDVAVPEPGEQPGVVRAAAQDLLLGRTVEDLVRAFGDVPGGPPVDVAGVPQQVLDLPGRTRRDGGVEPGPFGRIGQPFALAAQGVDVLGDLHRGQLSARRMSRAWARSAGYSLVNVTSRPSAGCANVRLTACSHCRVRPSLAASTGSAP